MRIKYFGFIIALLFSSQSLLSFACDHSRTSPQRTSCHSVKQKKSNVDSVLLKNNQSKADCEICKSGLCIDIKFSDKKQLQTSTRKSVKVFDALTPFSTNYFRSSSTDLPFYTESKWIPKPGYKNWQAFFAVFLN